MKIVKNNEPFGGKRICVHLFITSPDSISFQPRITVSDDGVVVKCAAWVDANEVNALIDALQKAVEIAQEVNA